MWRPVAVAALFLVACSPTEDSPPPPSAAASSAAPSSAASSKAPSSAEAPAPSGAPVADSCDEDGQYVVVYVLPDGKRGDLTVIASCKHDAEMQAYGRLSPDALVVAIYAL